MHSNRAIAQNTAIQIGSKIVSTLLGIVAIALMTRYLGLEQFGWFSTANGFLQFIGIMADFGFAVTISNMLAEPKFEQRAVLNTVFTWRLLTALLIHGLAPIIFLFFPYPSEVKIAVFIISISFLAIALNNIFIGWYRAKLSMWHATISEVLGRVALVLGIALVAVSRAGFVAAVSVVSAASFISALYLYIKIGGVKLALDKAISQDLFSKIWPTAISVLFNAFYLQGDRVILPLFVPQTTVGLYGASYRVLDVVIQLSAMVMGLVMPLITFAWSRGLKDEFRARYQLALDLLALILIPITVGLFILAGPLMRFVAGAEFGTAGAILRGLSISVFGTTLGMVFGHVALAINKQKQVLWIYISDAILSVVGYFIFIPRFGVMGAIGVTIFSEMYAGLLLMIAAIYYARLAPRFYTFFKIILASFIMGLGILAFPHWHVVWLIMLGGALYAFAAIVLLRVVPLQAIRELLRREPLPEPTNFDTL